MKGFLVTVLCLAGAYVSGQTEMKEISMYDLNRVLEVYNVAFAPCITDMINKQLNFKEYNNGTPQTDSLIIARKENRRSDSVYLFVKSIEVGQNIRVKYSENAKSFSSLADILKLIDKEYQAKFDYEGLPPEFYKEAHRKTEEINKHAKFLRDR